MAQGTKRMWMVAGGAVIVVAASILFRARRPPPTVSAPTFASDVAPIVFAKCAPCHRPEGAGPFPLLSFEDVTAHTAEIRKVTQTRFMPPWRPARGVAEYANDRSLTDEQIATIARWIDAGTPRGDAALVPPVPAFPAGWQQGEPDLVVTMTEPYSLAAAGRDVYRNFVIPAPAKSARWVRAWEFKPGTRTIHHAILNIDRYGLARRRDGEDPGPGYGGMDVGDVQSADGFYLVWTPGKFPPPPDPNAAFRIDDKTDLVLQLHLQSSGKPERVSPTIGLYFTDRAPTRPRFTLRVGDPPIDIPAGDAKWVARSSYPVTTDLDVVSVFPHAHYVAKVVRGWATLPDGKEVGLLRIDDWDFAWQDEYVFAHPVLLPKGSSLHMEITYDNSDANPRNPSRPPKRVVFGEQSTDEMGNLTFQVTPRDPKGLGVLREQKYRRALAASQSPRNHYNLANALAELGNADEAIEHYEKAIALDPKLVQARLNLALAYTGRGQNALAVAQLRAAVAADPTFVAGHVNLGNALAKEGDAKAALASFRSAVKADPRSALAHNSLGLALQRSGDHAAAIVELREALAIDPDNWMSHHYLGESLREKGETTEAITHYRRALELRPDAREPRERLEAIAPK